MVVWRLQGTRFALVTAWVKTGLQAILRVPSATVSVSGYNYELYPAHVDFEVRCADAAARLTVRGS
jgi:hypothetical protein